MKTARPVTAEELLRMPDDGMRRELVRGEVREMPPPGIRHGYTTGRMYSALGPYVDEKGLGIVSTEAGFVLALDPDTVLAPDCAFVRADRLPRPLPDGYVQLVPDLVVETLSPDDRPGRVREKVRDWLASGVRLVWVLDPRRRMVTVHRSGSEPRVLPEGGLLDGEDVVPGFSIRVSTLFECMSRP